MTLLQQIKYEVQLETTISYLREALQMCPIEDTEAAYCYMSNACYLLQNRLHELKQEGL